MLAIIVVGIFSLLLAVVLWQLETKRRFRSIAHIPGPRGVFLFGNVFDLGRNTKELLDITTELLKKYGKWVQLWIGPTKPYLVVSDRKFIECLLSSKVHIEKSSFYDFLKPWLGHTIVVATGAEWWSRRKLMTPLFHAKVILNCVDTFNSIAEVLIEKLSAVVDKESVDLVPHITLYTLDVTCETVMGTSVNAQRNEDSEYIWVIHNLTTIALERASSAWKQFDVLYKFTNTYKAEQKSLKILREYTDSVIAQRTAEIEKELAEAKENKAQNITEEIDKSRFSFLDRFIRPSYEAGNLPDVYTREEVDGLIFGAHDTTASALSFTLYEIAQHPDVQEKLVEEMRTVFADDRSKSVTYEDLNQSFKYMEMVIKEALRLYPSVPLFFRELKQNLDYDGLVLPKGLAVCVPVLTVHMDPELYPNPEEFIPERFDPASIKMREPFSFLAFSAGPRNCLGQKFAIIMMKATLVKVLRHFVLLPVPGHTLQLYSDLILKSDTGVCVRLKNREDF